jgi:hypothetical protein
MDPDPGVKSKGDLCGSGSETLLELHQHHRPPPTPQEYHQPMSAGRNYLKSGPKKNKKKVKENKRKDKGKEANM